MQLRSEVSLLDGQRHLQLLLKDLPPNLNDWNEATTRLHFIDKFLTKCLGWPRTPTKFRVETHTDGEFSDYVLGEPEAVIWEAKRAGAYFDFPADSDQRLVVPIQEIFRISKTAEEAMRQAQSYCNDSGVEFAVVSNGHQIIAFIAVRLGHSWLKGKALVLRNIDRICVEFPTIWQCLSPDGIFEKRLLSLLTSGTTKSIPRKLSSDLIHFPTFRYASELQANLRSLGELLLQDVVGVDSVRKQFYQECYCDTGALSRDTLINVQLLRARYAALFSKSEQAPILEPAAQGHSVPELSKQIMTEALSGRPIVLLGDVGVGKTSFLEQLMYIRAPKEFERSVCIYLDLGSKAALEHDIKKFVLDDIERQLFTNYKVDIFEHNFVRGVYDSEIKRFRSSFKAHIYKSNKTKLDEQLMARLDELVNARAEHLRRSIEHVALARRYQVIIILDNADQRAIDVQQSAFLIAQEFAKTWNALVFISVRPQTFFQSKRSGVLAAYPHKVFTILPPRPELVIEKRLIFALNVAEGRVSPDVLQGVRLNLGNIATFLRALIFSLEKNRDLTEILANITAGNIRATIEFITRFIGSPNVEAKKIVEIHEKTHNYIIPIHEFSKAAILGDYSHFYADSSLAINLFDVQSADRNEHFLALMVIAFLISTVSEKNNDGFIRTFSIHRELQSWSYLPEQINKTLRNLTNKRLIETTERVTFEEDLTGLIGDIPEGFRITSIGAYHIHRWAGDFSYLDAMVFDTPIFDPDFKNSLYPRLESFDITDRYNRTLSFRNYLTNVWDSANLKPSYLDWQDVVGRGQKSFDRVRTAIEKFSTSDPKLRS